MTIYDICYNFLSIIIDNFDEKYADRDKECKKLLDLLNKKIDFSETFKNDIASKGISEDALRKIMMLMITSKAYMYEIYACKKKIHTEEILDMLKGLSSTLEELTYTDIINLFMNNDDIVQYIIDDFFSYYDLLYIGQNQCQEYVFNDKEKLKCLLKMNPYELFKISNYIDSKDFLQTEVMIQDFFDTSETVYSILNSNQDEEEDMELDFLDDEEEIFFKTFLDTLQERFSDSYIDSFLLYVCSNVYELLTTNNHYEKNKEAKTLIDYLKETDKNEILNDLKTDYEFAGIIMKYFYDNNQFISRDELVRRRKKIKRNNDNLVIVKRLNPYYETEEKIFARKKIN